MNNEQTERRRKFIINTAFYAIVIALTFLVFKYLISWVMPFILGFIIAFVSRPLISFINKKTRINYKVCAIFVLILEYGVVMLLVWVLGSKIVSSFRDLFSQLPEYYNEFWPHIYETFEKIESNIPEYVLTQIYSTLKSFSENLYSYIVKLSSGTVSILAGATAKIPFLFISSVFTILASIFISMDYNSVISFLMKQMPDKARVFLVDAKKHLGKTILNYLKAYTIILIMTFSELFIGLTILKVNSALAISLIIAFADIFPIIGTGGILIPWAIISLISGNIYLGIGLLILYVIILIVRQFSEPKIVGDQLGLHPVLSLLAIYIGYRLFGVVGMIILPITANIMIALHKAGRIKLWID